nr:uncharacterized protein CI109_002273 [Kwoniella shandongensis]KAA5529380.1 hypothetical protein CI109_002273 [Kwoniella shandongensis]
MHHIVRTRSQHFVSSPRKTASPLITKHSLLNGRHPPKRRRLGSTTLLLNRHDTSSSDEYPAESSRHPSEPRRPSKHRKGKGRQVEDVFDDRDDSSSPRKRKRSRLANGSDGDSSWIDEGEEEPEFIAESDQHLIDAAPAYALHRLRKAELIRLWKVAGMWTLDDDEAVEDSDDEHVDELGKKELVDGLIAARRPDRLISPLPSPKSGSRSSSQPSASSSNHPPDTTPKAIPRTRSRVRVAETTIVRTAPRRTRDHRRFRNRSKSMGEDNRKARFGDDVKSPAKGLINRRTRRSSTLSSYTTTDRSTSSDPPARRPHHLRPTQAKSSDSDEATPLVQRLRPRNRPSFVKEQSSEVDADDEDAQETDPDSPRRLRTRDIDSDISMTSSKPARTLPTRGAKSRAIEALQGGESDTTMDIEDAPRSGPLTRSQLKSTSTPPRVESPDETVTPAPHTTRSGKAFGVMQSRRKRLRQEAMDDPDMEVDENEDEEDEEETDDDTFDAEIDLSGATGSSLTRMLRDELVQMCEIRGIEVGGTKPQLAKALIEWKTSRSKPSSQATARPTSSPRIIHAIGSAGHHPGKPTPVLLRDHIHATDPATPAHSGESRPIGSEAELNLDLSELGLEDSMIKPHQLVKLEKIGSGGFKDVFVGKLRGRKVAISEFRGHLSEMDIRELKLLAEFSHPNIVKFRGICIPEDSSQIPCMLVSELCENGDLFDYIRNVPCPTLKRLLGLMLDLSRGLEYLHTRKPSIIHRDCKSSNILINRQGQAKVGDFGLARVKNSTRSMIRSLVGTVNWQAPELWHPAPRYDYKVDVFSAAMVFWEMMSGWIGDKKYPWEGHNEHYIYDAVGTKHRRPSIVGLRKHWGDEPVNLMERMWHQDPAERPTMTDVVADLESLIAEC